MYVAFFRASLPFSFLVFCLSFSLSFFLCFHTDPIAAKEIVSSLERVVTQSDQLQRTLCSGGSGGGPTTAAGSIWVALLRGLRTLADANPVSAVVETVRNGCLTLGSQVSGKIVTRAAEFLLDELKPLQTMLQVRGNARKRKRVCVGGEWRKEGQTAWEYTLKHVQRTNRNMSY